MEELFLIFQKFFFRLPEAAERGRAKPPDPPQKFQKLEKNRQHGPAQGGEIGPASQQKGGPLIDAHLSRAPADGQQEQGGGRPQPEGQVQQKGQPFQRQAPPDGPHPVVHQAQRRAQQKALAEQRGLGRHIRGHISAAAGRRSRL